MSATHFNYFDDWQSAILHCHRCGWTGTIDEGSVECHEHLMDSLCSSCDFLSAPMLAIVSYPTIEEYEANWEKLSEGEKQSVNRRKQIIAASIAI